MGHRNEWTKFLTVLAAAGAVALPLGGGAWAAEKRFADTLGGLYQDPANWSPAGIPLAGDTIIFELDTPGYPLLLNANATALNMDVLADTVNVSLGGFTLTLTGSSPMDITGSAFGEGRLSITNGTIDANNAGSASSIGGTGTTGRVTLNAGAAWVTAGLNIGTAGTGSLTVNSGGDVTSTSATLGLATSSSGTATISGAGSTWQAGTILTVGNGSGTGALTVSGGGLVGVSDLTIAGGSTSSGSVSIGGVGSIMNVGDSMLVGSAGIGALTMSGAGAVNVTNSTVVGAVAGSSGAIRLLNPGTILNAGLLTVGSFGEGSISVEQDADLTIDSLSVVGGQAGSRGDVTLRDLGSTWTSGGASVWIGGSGAGSLLIERGASATFGTTILAQNSTGSGQITVRNNGALTTANLLVGSFGTGMLVVESGGSVVSAQSSLGTNTTGNGSATLTGPGTSWATDSLTVGGSSLGATTGTGVLVVNQGATVSTAAGSSFRVTEHGRVDLNGGTITAGSLVVNAGGVFNFNAGTVNVIGPSAVLNVGASGPLGELLRLGPAQRINVTNNVTVDAGALLLMEGGTLLLLTSAASTLSNNGEVRLADAGTIVGGGTVSNSGLLRGNGRVAGRMINNAAGEIRVAAGERLTFTSNLPHTNSGRITMLGGEIDFPGPLDSPGVISGRGMLRTTGLTVGNQLQLSGGVSDIFGTVNNDPGAKTIISGGASASFYDTFTNDAGAELRVSVGSVATFFAPVNNSGLISGGGNKRFEALGTGLGELATTGSSVIAATGAATATHIREAALTVEGTVAITPNGTALGTSRLGELSIDPGAAFDLANNDLIVDGGDLAEISGYIAANRLRSSLATATRTLGVMLNGGRFTDFSGQSVSPDDVLVKYTYFGDTNMDGRVSIVDYLAADRGAARGLSGWANGDFDYSGVIDGGDYFLIDSAFLAQGAPLVSSDGGGVAAAVPEPGAAAVVMMAAVPFCGRRRRR